MEVEHPLKWPANRARHDRYRRRHGRFGHGRVILDEARQRLVLELGRLSQRCARYAVLTYDDQQLGPRADPGAAVYFNLDDRPHCLPCDTYSELGQNVAAIAAHIEATRAVTRHGVGSVAEQFAGFQALPSPTMERPWRSVFNLGTATVDRATLEAIYRRLARERHPDNGGSDSMMAELNRARDEARRELG